MADEFHYSSTSPSAVASHKRKYDDNTPPLLSATRSRPSGFSSPNSALPPPPPLYNSVPPPVDGFQAAKQKAQEIAARLLAAANSDPKRPRVETNSSSFSPPPDAKPYYAASPSDGKPAYASPSPIPVSYGSSYMGSSTKRIEIPNGRVGVIIGKGGETIKYLQIQSGAKIQVTRDMDADPHAPMRPVELVGTPDQVEKAEQLIRDVLAEADTGGSGTVARRFPGGQGGGGGGQGSDGSDHIILKVPNNKVGLVIGKGGETIKSMQARTGARIQVIPLHPPPGDTSQERSVHIEGTNEQIEAAKQLIDEVCSSENRTRNQSMGGGYSQQGYQARPPTNWAPAGVPPVQQSGYGYMQPGAYPGQTQQYNMPQPSYGGYPQQTPGGYPSNWDQSGQQTSQTYDYYSQAPAQEQPTPGGSAAPTDNSGYNYSQPPTSGYNQQGQGYSQDGYGGYSQSGYGLPQYDQQSYGSAHGYGSAVNPTQEGHNASYGAQGDSTQVPPQAPAQGYSSGQQPSPNTTGYPPQAATQPGYGVPPSSQAGYGSQTAAPTGYGSSYGPPQGQKQPANPPTYGQPQRSPGAAYGQHPPAQPGYPPSQPPPDLGSQRVPPSYGAAGAGGQAAYGYGGPPAAQPGYGQGPPPPAYGSYATSYAQPAAYNTDGSATNNVAAQPAQQSGAAKASPPS